MQNEYLNDKELREKIQDIVWDYKCDEANLFDSKEIADRILALLQPKIEEAVKAEHGAMIKYCVDEGNDAYKLGKEKEGGRIMALMQGFTANAAAQRYKEDLLLYVFGQALKGGE